MNIALLQLDIHWGALSVNIGRAEQLMGNAPDADLYVLPEMWTTGFSTLEPAMAEDEAHSEALQWMRQTACQRQCAVCGSLAVRTGDGKLRNRLYFVTPDAEWFYDKHHLFRHGHEDHFFTAGHRHVVAEWQGVRFLLLTCYDLRFPVWSRYGLAGEYDAIIYVASWPQSRQTAWDVLLHARAIENQCYVIGVNRVGDDPVTHYSGGSVLIDPIGRTVAMCKENAEQSLMATLGMDSLRKARSRFRVLDDRDPAILTNGIKVPDSVTAQPMV